MVCLHLNKENENYYHIGYKNLVKCCLYIMCSWHIHLMLLWLQDLTVSNGIQLICKIICSASWLWPTRRITATETRRPPRLCRHHIGNTHSCLLLYYILAEEELFSLLAAEMVSVEINVHDNASIVVIVLKIWWCPLRLLLLMMILMLKLSLHNDAFSK